MLEMTFKEDGSGIRCRDKSGGKWLDVKWPDYRYYAPAPGSAIDPRVRMKPSEFYAALVKEKRDHEDIIQRMIRYYIPWRLFNFPEFEHEAIVIGLLGRRGAGKTASAVYMAIFDYLIRGKPVFSNVDIAVKVFYKAAAKLFTSNQWNGVDLLNLPGAEGGVVIGDEANISLGDSSRYSSGANLALTNDLQQIRKRNLNVIWSAQKFGTVDSRTHFQTDFFIEIEDCYHLKKYKPFCKGDKCYWRCFDNAGLSGLYDFEYSLTHRYISQYPCWEGMHWIRPIWPAYDTYKEQSSDFVTEYKARKAEDTREKRIVMLEEAESYERDIVEQILAQDRRKFYAEDLWGEIDANDTEKAVIGRLLREHYHHKREASGARRYYYEKKAPGTP